MKYLQPYRRFAPACRLLLTGLLCLGAARGQSQPTAPTESASPYAAVKTIRLIEEKEGPAIEIISTKPLIPSIVLLLKTPPRLVIDLPRARIAVKERRVSVQAHQITTLRADQYQEDPPVTRIVLDLLSPRAYTWSAAGNRLLVHLGKDPEIETARSPFQGPAIASLTPAPKPIAAVVPSGAPVSLVGSGIVSGTSITAGADTALLKLARGGEVNVCPGTTVSVTPSKNGHNVMFGLDSGAMEAHYVLDASSDSVMTPDFRILLTGPGEFHYAISSDNHGNTCVRSLPGNTASAIVSELMGDRNYQVKANDQLVFRSGQLEHVDMNVPLECGCPPPREPVLRATNTVPVEANGPSQNINLAAKPAANAASGASTGISPPASPSPAEEKSTIHVQLDAPMVFRAPPPAPVVEAQALPVDSRPYTAPALAAPLPPAPIPAKAPVSARAESAPRRGFFKRFFSAIFH